MATESQIQVIQSVPSDELLADEIACLRAFEAAQQRNYQNLLNLSIDSIKSYDNNATVIDKWLLGSGC